MIENLPPGRPVTHPDVAARIVAGEAVVLSPNQHMVRMFNEVGTRIWELADGAHTPDDIAVQLTEEYEVELPDAQTHTARFLGELHARDLLTWV